MIAKPRLLSVAVFCTSLCAVGMAQAQPAPPAARAPAAPALQMAPAGGPSAGLPVAQISAKLDVDNTTTVSGQKIKLHAVFRRAGVPINGASLQFKIDSSSVGQGVTDANGTTDVPYKLIDGLALGEHLIHVRFPGDNKTPETTASGKLTVLRSITTLTAPFLFENGPPFATIRGTLRGASDDVRLANRTVLLKDHGAAVETYTTLYNGDFIFHIEPSAGHKFTVEFDGETNYLGTTKAAEYAGPKSSGWAPGPHINTQVVKP